MVATVLTACGIETGHRFFYFFTTFSCVATVLTACGIETPGLDDRPGCRWWLQQCLPLAVLKLYDNTELYYIILRMLQQCLPLAVLKLKRFSETIHIGKLQQCLPLAVLKLLMMKKLYM